MSNKYTQIVTLDCETYFAKDYSLKLKRYNLSEYIRDPQFKLHCMAIKIDDALTHVYYGDDIESALDAIDWSRTALLAHNVAFDGFILSHHYGIVPAYYLDTLSMARAVHSNSIRANLDSVAGFYKVGNKLPDVLEKTKGIIDLAPDLLAALGDYCAVDVDLCYDIFNRMRGEFIQEELDLVSLTAAMFCDPVLFVNIPRAEAALKKELEQRAELIAKTGETEKNLRSGAKLAVMLRALGVEPPLKVSPTNPKKKTFAFAKNDLEFQDLLEHPDEAVRDLVAARIAAKSTIEETRAIRFIQAGSFRRKLPVLLSYFGAHTSRWTGGNRMNMQNLPRDGELRKSITAPEGYQIVWCDSAQIEARTLAWLADHAFLLNLFASGQDVYKHQAAAIYRIPFDQVSPAQRFVGKVCLGADTCVITNRGIVPIIEVRSSDMLWDGVEWVTHKGLIFQGIKATQTFSGVTATAGHEILTENCWRKWSEVRTDPSLFQSALSLGSLPSSVGPDIKQRRADRGDGTQYVRVPVDGQDQSTETTYEKDDLHVAINVRLRQLGQSVFGYMKTLCLMQPYVLACLTGYLQQSIDATIRKIEITIATVFEAFQYVINGVKTRFPFLNTYKLSPAGITQAWKWIELTQMEIMNREIYGSQQEKKTLITSVRCQYLKPRLESLKPVYDLINAGPRNRFSVMTDEGPIIVRNCTLGLGYGMGVDKFQYTLAAGNMGPAVKFPIELCREIVGNYRVINLQIARLWSTMNEMLGRMVNNIPATMKCLEFWKDHIQIPNGIQLHYPNLEGDWDPIEEKYREFRYYTLEEAVKKRMKLEHKSKKMYGGLLTENVVQALARVIVANQMLEISRRYRVVLFTHDEVVCLVKNEEVEEAKSFMREVMSQPPNWGPSIPLAAEVESGVNYG